MAKIKLTTVAFKGTAAQEAKLRAELRSIKEMPGSMMPALQAAQEIYGYLPIEVQKIVAEELGTSLEEVFGVATFYSQFSLNPKGEHAVAVCMGTACYVKGSGDVFTATIRTTKESFMTTFAELGLSDGATTSDGKFSLCSTRCIGCCGLAPVMTVGDDVYGKLTPADIPGILAKYRD